MIGVATENKQDAYLLPLTADQVLHDGDVVSRSDGFGTTAAKRPGSGRPQSIGTTDNIAVVQELDLQSAAEVMHSVLRGDPYRSTF